MKEKVLNLSIFTGKKERDYLFRERNGFYFIISEKGEEILISSYKAILILSKHFKEE